MMFSKFKLIGYLILSMFFVFSTQAADNKLKVAFVYVSPIGDAGWTYQHDLGRKAVEEKFGDKVDIKYVDSVKEGTEGERVTRDLASKGYKIIFGTSFGYMNPMLKVAKAYPKTHFDHATGYKTAKNMGNYNARFYEGRYLAGMVAGSMTKSNILGYVGAFPIPEVVQGINAYTLGAQSVNPDVSVRVIWVNSWFDPGRERQAATTLINQKADIITHHTDSTAATVTAQEKKVYAIAYHSDMSKYGKDAHLTAVVHHWEKYYIDQVQAVLDGTWKPSSVWGGVKDGMISLAPLSKAVPAAVAEKVSATTEKIRNGSLQPFAGPIVDQAGTIKVAEGKAMTDKELSGMNFYVKGIVGSLPK